MAEIPQESILNSVKLYCNVDEDNCDFDQELFGHINEQFLTLHQIGVGPDDGFILANDTMKWSDFVSDVLLLASVPQYVRIRVRLVFDPPANAMLKTAMSERAAELEWRIRERAADLRKVV